MAIVNALQHLVVVVAVIVSSAAAYGQEIAAQPQPEVAHIRVHGAALLAGDAEMVTQVFKPAGAGPFPVVVYSHGRAESDVQRRQMTRPIPLGHVRYWTDKGFAVVAPIRPGYGATGSFDRENSGARYDDLGNCRSLPDFERAAEHAREATLAAIDWVRGQDWARRDFIVLEGTSMGGLTTVATAAVNPPGVVGYINFAGGAGGDPQRAPGKSCGAKAMVSVMASYGKTTRVPGLWLYAENDRYWGPEAPRAWFDAFAAGGSPARMVMTAPVPDTDGHMLLLRGGRLWSVHTDRFIHELGM